MTIVVLMLVTPTLSAAHQHYAQNEDTPVSTLSASDISHSEHKSTLKHDHCSHLAAHFMALPSVKGQEFIDNSKRSAACPNNLMGYLLLDLPYSPPKS